ncbi:transporter, SSS family [Leptospira ryugenii]|uniref:Transporter, SSS family n=1 Tax=Leptospira ryugenii TaxID=1917863 RepID=A0A2P2E1V5_9LEPT|nr:sodium/solute symporter [Leptospira ryugenii]GBF50851.1 transporter, SSS family [Leptospira ryugenii]
MLTSLDFGFFAFTFLLVLLIGIYAGRKESDANDYFLGGRSLPWWAVAGSLFGTNVSANHLVGMLGIGFSVGFAQSHYEFGSILAIYLLAFVFLPLFRKQKLYTLSQFLEVKFGKETARIYSGLCILLIIIQMTGALYIGARSFLPFLQISGISFSYSELVLIISFTSTIYTWFGGLKSVVYTDVIQTVLILLSGLLLFYLALNRPEVGGFNALLLKESLRGDELSKMNLYLPSNHPILPWSGALSGLFLLHIFYWNTNQYVVQRTLGARNMKEARLGILTGGFLKLSIPFFSILTGVAAYQIWSANPNLQEIDPDETFSRLVVLVVPVGYGLIGIILAGLLGAIFSSIDSMLHSAATLFTIDFFKPYREHIGKPSSDQLDMRVGRIFLLLFSILVTAFALFLVNPKSKDNFFIELSSQSSHFTPALLASFILGMLGYKIHQKIVVSLYIIMPLVSLISPTLYELLGNETIFHVFGSKLNFLHRVLLVFSISIAVMYVFRIREPKKVRSYNHKTLWIGLSIFLLILVLLRIVSPSFKVWWAFSGGISIFGLFLFVSWRTNQTKITFENLYRKKDRWLFGLLLGLTFFFYLYF